MVITSQLTPPPSTSIKTDPASSYRLNEVHIKIGMMTLRLPEMRPLDGITVLDLSRLPPGGAATLLFANHTRERSDRGTYNR